MAAVYQVILKDPDTGKVWELIPKSYNFTERLNEEPIANFNFSFEELKKLAETTDTTVINMFTGALREILITRNEATIYLGVLVDFEVQPGGQGEKNVNVRSMGYLGMFKKRLVGIGVKETFTTTDAGDIAWTLIENSQLDDTPYSDLGITEGSITISKNRTRSYLFDNIYDNIRNLSNYNLADGFDFEIDTSKAFNVYYPQKGSVKPNIVFDERTMSGWKFKMSFILEMANTVYALGEGENEDIEYETRQSSTTIRTPFSTLEEKLQTYNVSESGTLQDKGDRRLAEAESPIKKLDSVEHYEDEILYTDYSLGDTVKVNLSELGISSESFRVIERTFTMQSPDGIALISLVLE